jgi:hypothetical protein
MAKRLPGATALVIVFLLGSWAASGSSVAREQLESFGAPASFYGRWHVKRWAGIVSLEFLRDGARPYLQLSCPSSSWAFYRKVDVDLARTPCLSWSWKADVLPVGGDGRYRATDDEAGQVYVLFPGRGLLGSLRDRILEYTWETVPPKGILYTPQRNADTRVFVLRNATDGLGVWKTEVRDVAADYRLAFGETPPNPVGVSFQIDSDDTRSLAKSCFADLAFEGR